jgi:hypothetical protein
MDAQQPCEERQWMLSIEQVALSSLKENYVVYHD